MIEFSFTRHCPVKIEKFICPTVICNKQRDSDTGDVEMLMTCSKMFQTEDGKLAMRLYLPMPCFPVLHKKTPFVGLFKQIL